MKNGNEPPRHGSLWKRRDVMKTGLATAGFGGVISAAEAENEARRSTAIADENAKQGTADWRLDRVEKDTSPIEGFASKQSVAAGETIELKVSTRPASNFKVEIFRSGYYGGLGARKIHELGPLQGVAQKRPEPSQGSKRLIECAWETTAEVKIPDDWVSGVYLARLTTLPDSGDDFHQSYIVFIVRDERPCDLLFQCSDNTWQAYNVWGGGSLYKHPAGNQRAFGHVSFDRPYGKYPQGFMDNDQSTGSGEWLLFEYPLAYWLEREGYDVSYASNSDLLAPDRALKCKGLLSVGHDEYWDLRQFYTMEKLRDAGVSLLFFSANTCCWVSPLMDSTDGRANRITHRGGPYGAQNEYAITREKNYGSYPHRGPDEGLLLGARNIHRVIGHGDWTCSLPDHWMFEGTGMKKGDSVQGLVGWEIHGQAATEIPGLEIVGSGTAWQGQLEKIYTATVYPGPKDNFVWNAATIFWSQGLASPPGHQLPKPNRKPILGPDERVEKMTRNLIERAIA
jgi:hypothetical protein